MRDKHNTETAHQARSFADLASNANSDSSAILSAEEELVSRHQYIIINWQEPIYYEESPSYSVSYHETLIDYMKTLWESLFKISFIKCDKPICNIYW